VFIADDKGRKQETPAQFVGDMDTDWRTKRPEAE